MKFKNQKKKKKGPGLAFRKEMIQLPPSSSERKTSRLVMTVRIMWINIGVKMERHNLVFGALLPLTDDPKLLPYLSHLVVY